MNRTVLFIPIVVILLSCTIQAQVPGGDYYIPQGTHSLGYASLAAAFSDINANGVSGTVNLLIDADITEVGSNLTLNRSDLTSTDNVVIRPAPGKTVTITIDGSGPLTIKNTPYVTIDGSNNNTTSRDLTIYQSAAMDKVIYVYGNSDHFTLKNAIVSYPTDPSSLTNWAFYSDVPSGITSAPDSALLDNNILGSTGLSRVAAFYLSGNSSTLIYPTAWRLTRNTFYGKLGGYAGMSMYYAGQVGTTMRIEDNVFNADNGNSGTTIIQFSGIEGDFYFQRNQVHTFSGNVDNGTIRYINIFSARDGGGNFYIINNFVGGNAANGSVAPAYFELIDCAAIMNYYIYHNTFRQNALLVNPTTYSSCLNLQRPAEVKDNIIIQDINAANAYAIYAGAAITSDYNNVVVASNAYFGQYSGTNYKTLSDWQTGTSQDANTTTAAVSFVDNALDFHLAGSSIGDANLAGTPIAGVTKDIDNETRNATAPYKGADENVDNPLPVTLSSFVALPEASAIRLVWKTESEIDNVGFILNRATQKNGPFQELASYKNHPALNGKGNTATPQTYEFVDKQVASNITYWYRLESVDYDGSRHTLQTISASVILTDNPLTRDPNRLPHQFSLHPNFPNPFNPVTYIQFDIAETRFTAIPVRLEIFDLTGRVIRTLVDAQLPAGSYTIQWDGRNNQGKPVSSGQYIYRLTAGSYTQSRTLFLLK